MQQNPLLLNDASFAVVRRFFFKFVKTENRRASIEIRRATQSGGGSTSLVDSGPKVGIIWKILGLTQWIFIFLDFVIGKCLKMKFKDLLLLQSLLISCCLITKFHLTMSTDYLHESIFDSSMIVPEEPWSWLVLRPAVTLVRLSGLIGCWPRVPVFLRLLWQSFVLSPLVSIL